MLWNFGSYTKKYKWKHSSTKKKCRDEKWVGRGEREREREREREMIANGFVNGVGVRAEEVR